MKERDLIEALRTGDSLAYSQLLDEYQQKVFSTCLSFVPNREDAEDISQEVFVEVFNSVGKFNGRSKLGTWIYRIAVNKSLEFIRKKNTKKRFGFMQSLSGNVVPVDRSSYFTEFNHPGIQLENKERTELLFRAIDQLPEAQKVVFTLHRIDGMSHKEVAEITKKSISSVESIMFRAKKNLQKILYNYYKNEDA
ncbi:RNA polymerase sigma factor [Poritiphilus flavus]|uniref:Sigma-70 family RNA polymerase sigma factor n=1 Tax=Poritiphilus flavus TaxID=2697053 RepID=A0A6L9EB47_9FLAO|nr:RNA polymerase sigma factor [Poritiphilus flavus]NAS11659.1 sigma-70 family RNA polymerase sigma factor [Poritiphilus flavus]